LLRLHAPLPFHSAPQILRTHATPASSLTFGRPCFTDEPSGLRWTPAFDSISWSKKLCEQNNKSDFRLRLLSKSELVILRSEHGSRLYVKFEDQRKTTNNNKCWDDLENRIKERQRDELQLFISIWRDDFV
jgi:hypothetical protein